MAMVATHHHTTTGKQTKSLALTSELQDKNGGGVGAPLPLCMSKKLQAHPTLDSDMPPNSLAPLTAAIIKPQDAKIHSRKNSATYMRA